MVNPLGRIADTTLSVVATGVRAVASLINSTADRAKGLGGVSAEPEEQDSIESLAAAAVEREMAQEPAGASVELDSEPEADELLTPSGIPAAGPGVNPDTTETDLHQRDTEPLLDPATVKAVKKESDVLRAAAERRKG